VCLGVYFKRYLIKIKQMKITITSGVENNSLIVVPVFKGEKISETMCSSLFSNDKKEKLELIMGNFPAELGKYITTIVDNMTVVILGLGDKKKKSNITFRKAYGQLHADLKNIKSKKITLCFYEDKKEIVKSSLEGFLLGGYVFTKYKKDKLNVFEEIFVITKQKESFIKDIQSVTSAVCYVRDLVNTGPSDMSPENLQIEAEDISKKSKYINLEVWDSDRLQKEGMNGIYQVGRGSEFEPRFIQLHYKNTSKQKKPIVLVGKGISFDSGGYNVKPTKYIEEMKMDMAGAATVLGVFKLLAELEPKIFVIGLIPTAENMVSSNAYRPGDVIKMYNGKTVEVLNTDAEGRLILADALSFASKLDPEHIVDMATLTGAVLVALGYQYTAVLGNDNKLVENIKKSFDKEDEKIWELPLDHDYNRHMESQIADLKNISDPNLRAGTVTAALFLETFVDKKSWSHLDIAGSAWCEESLYYEAHGGTGSVLRSLWGFVCKSE